MANHTNSETIANLLDLPRDLIRESLLPFLKISDLVQIDVAVCTTQHRPHFIDSMCGLEVDIPTHVNEVLIGGMTWLLKKRMLLRSFFLLEDPSVLNNLVELNLMATLRSIRTLNVRNVGNGGELLVQLMESIAEDSIRDFAMNGSMPTVTDSALALVLSSQKRITRIQLTYAQLLTDETLVCIADSCSELEELEIVSSWNIPFGVHAVTSLASRCTKLRKIHFLCDKELDVALQQISVHCVHLEELNLLGCRRVTDRAILPILVNRSGTLKVLNLITTDMTNISFIEAAQRCKVLQDLAFPMCTSDEKIAEGFSQLAGTLVSFAGQIAPDVLALSVKFWGKMTSINLSISHVTGAALLSIARTCPNLTIFKFFDHDNTATTDTLLCAFATLTPLLQTLIIYGGGENITDQGVIALSVGCKELRWLAIRASTALTHLSLTLLVQNCVHLSHVELAACVDEKRIPRRNIFKIPRCKEQW